MAKTRDMQVGLHSASGILSDKTHLGQILLRLGYINERQLSEALEYQKINGGRLGWILASLGYISRIDLYKALSEHFRLPFVLGVENILREIDEDFVRKFNYDLLFGCDIIPAKIEGNILKIFTPDPTSQALNQFLNRYFNGFKVDIYIITDLDFMKVLSSIYQNVIIDRSIMGLFYISPEYSASQVFSKGQIVFIFFLFFLFCFCLYFNALLTLIIVIGILQVFYLSSICFKLILSIFGSKSEMEQFITDEEVKSLENRELPVYTILIPVYKEARVIPTLIDALKKIDYPQDKLDVILLLEEDDSETLEAAKRCHPPANWRFIIVPNSIPKTKPKACNYGLMFAKGKYLTIYDAEDIPEPDQLKKAVLSFKKGGKEYICFQAALNYFNKDENFLTKMFTLEYSYWFDYMLPGLFYLKLPIPLGGTSNHFDTEKLRNIGGWDPFNTTEDADLGIRAFGRGYKVGIINSTTYEEANSKLRNWVRQRSRWIKGYMQTFLVHSRNIKRLYNSVGMRGSLAFFLLIGGTPFTFLVNPIMWVMFIIWLLTATEIFPPLFPSLILYISAFNLLFGNFLVIYLNMLAVFKRGYYNLLPYSFLNPLYWILHSIAAYKALYDLFVRPFHWEKTIHGISKIKPPSVSQ